MLEAIKTRQSIRKYQDKAVEMEKIDIILEAAMNAPTARNTQEWEFMVITNRDALDKMTELSPYTTMMKEAPVAILVYANMQKAINHEYALINCAAAIENLIIEATHLELGTCWCGIAPVDERIEKFKQYFNLTDDQYPVGVVAIGYSNEKKPLINTYDATKVKYFR
ncbi:nitroreductase family protein [Thomasclavelia sp.]|uniref:nitroreductase family protein n=1 Tax=Thomasclavelia sp. TaxID=3025757 RepID=UPI0025FEAB4A|nr:nitroreductase family protein [Thomasclavelia sp.]